MHRTLLLVFLLAGRIFFTQAEEIFSADIAAIFNAQEIITGKIKGVHQGIWRVEIVSQLKGNLVFTLNNTSEVLIPAVNSAYSTSNINELVGKEYVFYIVKDQAGWKHFGGSQQSKPLVHDKIPFVLCGNTFYFSNNEFKKLTAFLHQNYRQIGPNSFERFTQGALDVPLPLQKVVEVFKGCMQNVSISNGGEVLPVEEKENALEDTTIYTFPEKSPSLLEGHDQLYLYISAYISQHPLPVKLSSTHRVFLAFVVEKDGTPSQCKVVRSSKEILNNYTLKMVGSMRFIPAENNGVSVRCKYILPITFRIQ